MGYDNNEFQRVVSETIKEEHGQTVTAKLVENHNAVVIETEDHDAAFTAQEARDLAHDVSQFSDMRWEEDTDELIMYLFDLADVVDGRLDPDEVREKWNSSVEISHMDVINRDTKLRNRERDDE